MQLFSLYCRLRFLTDDNLDELAFCGPNADTHQMFGREKFIVWLLTMLDDTCLPLVMVILPHYCRFVMVDSVIMI